MRFSTYLDPPANRVGAVKVKYNDGVFSGITSSVEATRGEFFLKTFESPDLRNYYNGSKLSHEFKLSAEGYEQTDYYVIKYAGKTYFAENAQALDDKIAAALYSIIKANTCSTPRLRT